MNTIDLTNAEVAALPADRLRHLIIDVRYGVITVTDSTALALAAEAISRQTAYGQQNDAATSRKIASDFGAGLARMSTADMRPIAESDGIPMWVGMLAARELALQTA